VIEYYPFGGTRLDDQTAAFGEQRRFTGHEFDTGTGLNYMDARYEGPNLARFLSQDPSFITASSPDWTGNTAAALALSSFVSSKNVNYLANAQNLNAYSYVNNNPLRYIDPDGKAVIGGSFNFGFLLAGGSIGVDVDTNSWKSQLMYGPSAGVDLGARFQGHYDPTGTLDSGGTYIISTANFTPGVGRSYSFQQTFDLNLSDLLRPTIGPQSQGKWNWSFGLEVGSTACLCYKTQPSNIWGSGSGQSAQSIGGVSSSNMSYGATNLNRLGQAVVSYGNSSGANLTDFGFIASLRAINDYDNSLYTGPQSPYANSTPTTLSSK
jgi:RHS repeat-associated protein